VMQMLHKQPAARPSALEVRQAARTIASELSQAREAEPLPPIEPLPPPPLPLRSPRAYKVSSDEVVVVDAIELEFGVTEMLPAVRQPRWTPEIADLPSVLVEPRTSGTIAPRAARDQVAGEIIGTDKRR